VVSDSVGIVRGPVSLKPAS